MARTELMNRIMVWIVWAMVLSLSMAFITADAWAKSKPNMNSITVKHMDIAELYEMLAKQYKVNIILADGVEGEVSINLYNVSVREAIYAVATAAGLAVERKHRKYIISKPDHVGKTIASGLTQTRTYKIQYSDIKNVSEIVENHLSRYGKVDILDNRNILVVEDTPEFLNKVELLLDALDHEPGQILIEAKILTVNLDDTQKFGVDWTKSFADGKGKVGFESLGDQVLDLGMAAATGPPGLFFKFVDDSIEAQLQALSRKGRVHTLASPQLLALENQEARVIIGERTGYLVTTTINQVTTESVEFLESGVILNVTPHIDRSGRIMMRVHPEVSKTSVNDGIPSQITTEVHTDLLVQDGQTVFIGGLIKNDVVNTHTGVPFLEDLPFLGLLFSKEDDISLNTEIIVIIKPTIIRPNMFTGYEQSIEKVENFQEQASQDKEEINRFFERDDFTNWRTFRK